MKKLFVLAVISFMVVSTINAQILAQSGGYQFTEADFQKEVKFVQFVFNYKLTDADIAQLRSQEIEAFKQNPAQTLANIQSLDQQMQQFYNLTDPLQIGIAQSALIAALYPQVQTMEETDVFKQLFNKYITVLAIDPTTQLALTQDDIDGYFDYMEFIYSLYDMPTTFDYQTRQYYTPSFVNYFLYGDQQTKITLAAMDIVATYFINIYNSLSPAEQQQFKQNLMAQNTYNQNQYYDNSNYNYDNYNYDNNYYTNNYNNSNQKRQYTDEELQQILDMMKQRQQMSNMMFNTMNNIMMMNHATTSNIISNIGSGDTYWDVVDYDY